MSTSSTQDISRALFRAGIDASALEAQGRALRAGELGVGKSRLTSRVEPPLESELCTLPEGEERARLEALGLRALARGEVGICLLAGGMATRFGGVVKAEVDVVPGVTFLEAKLRDAALVAERAGGKVHVLAMTSFATHARVSALLESREGLDLVRAFEQNRSARLDAQGNVVLAADGTPSLYATGHGDLTFALRSSGTLRAFREAGGRHLFVTNVDNVGATIDPVLVGLHIDRARPMTVEVVRKNPGDKGGAPARVAGRLRLVESFLFPEGFDESTISVFNTNSIWLDAAAIDRDFTLPWHAVEKTVDDKKVIQLERLVGELSSELDATYVIVPREGLETRFLPVKEVADLERQKDVLLATLRARGVA